MIHIDKKTYIVIGCLLVIVLISYKVWSNGNVVSDNGTGVDTVRSELGTAINQQSTAIATTKSIETGLNDSIKSVGNIESTVSHATATNTTSIATATDSASLIADCQRILRDVRKSGKIKD
jgi:uncharacterized membrane protein